MPNQTTSKRISISLKPNVYSLIFDLAEMQNKPMSRVVVDLLDEFEPLLANTVSILKELEKSNNKDDVLRKFGQDFIMQATSELGDISKKVSDL